MIDRLCKNLEGQAMWNGHIIGNGFREVLMLGKVKMLRLDCQTCDFFIMMEPSSGKYLESNSGLCRRNNGS